MIRPVTCVCLLMAAGSGLYLYQAKHQAQLLDREITRTMNEVSRLSQRIGVLRADYQLEQDPETLGELTRQYLADLKPTAPGQFTTWAELEKLLPPIPSPPAAEAVAPEDGPAARAEPPHPAVTPEPAHAEATRTEPPPARPTATRPSVPPVAAIAMAPLVSPAPPPTATASRPVGHGVLAVARQAPATIAPALASAGPTLPSAGAAAARAPAPASLVPVSLAPGSLAPGSPAPREAAIRPQPSVLFAARPSPYVPPPAYSPNGFAKTAPAAPPMVASALGMARAMLAPVAVPPANAAPTYPTRYPAGNAP
jgi:hypothetical protein